ncbi:pilin [Patescibacteria group bacterium]|nr:pilin [Patescibacteria group bacterium]
MKNLKKHILLIFLVLISHLYTASPVFAQTTNWTGVCVSGIDNDATTNDVATIQGLECLIANIFTVIITLIGLGAFVMFIVGSVLWLISGGSTEGTKKARDTLTYAVLGIVVALGAFIVLNLIAGFTGVETIKQFIIPTSNP